MYNNVVETRKFKRHNGFDIDNHINKNTQDINTELRLPETNSYRTTYSNRNSIPKTV